MQMSPSTEKYRVPAGKTVVTSTAAAASWRALSLRSFVTKSVRHAL